MKTLSLLLTLLITAALPAQDQITVTTPVQSLTDGYSENFGIGLGVSGPGFFFNNGIGGPVAPFGPVPNVASFAGSSRLGALNFRWNVFGGQSSQRSLVTAAPSVTMMNGSSGFFASGSVRPFVTGFVPIVGEYVSPIDVSLERLEASGGLEYVIAQRRAERRRAEAEEDRLQQQQLLPLSKEDDPPLILDGNERR